jgi:hypothetical protein
VINVLPLTIEALVASLLLLTILYCVRLNSQLTRLKADEAAMRAIVAELMTATETAERSIAGLTATVRDADQSLGERLRAAEQFCTQIETSTKAGESVLNRLAQVANAYPWLMGVKSTNDDRPAAPDPKSIIAATQALTKRAQARLRASAA